MTETAGPRRGTHFATFVALVGGIAVVLVAVGLVIGLSQGNDAPPPPPTETPEADVAGRSTEVELSLDVELLGDRIVANGIATVPDGALIAFEVSGPEDCTDCRADGRVPVMGEEFSFSINIAAWTDGEYTVWAAFQPVIDGGSQPQEVIDRYGESGEHITGDTVEEDGLTWVEVETTVSP